MASRGLWVYTFSLIVPSAGRRPKCVARYVNGYVTGLLRLALAGGPSHAE